MVKFGGPTSPNSAQESGLHVNFASAFRIQESGSQARWSWVPGPGLPVARGVAQTNGSWPVGRGGRKKDSNFKQISRAFIFKICSFGEKKQKSSFWIIRFELLYCENRLIVHSQHGTLGFA